MESVSHERLKEKSDAACCGCCEMEKPPNPQKTDWNLYFPTFIGFGLLVSGMALNYYETPWFSGYAKLVWFIAAYLPVGGKVLWYAVKNISKGQVFNEFFLMGIATLGAFFIGEYAEAVAVMLFYVIGEHFQEAAVKKSRSSIKDLIDSRPNVVQVFRNGEFVGANPETVQIGETVQLKAGDKVALDGKLLSDSATFNTSALTGEAKPDTKHHGETVLAGMVNLNRVVEVEVSKVYEDSALSKILILVEDAVSKKAKTQRFITRFAKVYTPIVVFLAVALTFLPYFLMENYIFQEWLYRALVFLVVSCPCALVVSIPLGYFGGIGAASKNGILFKGANYLDVITKLDIVVFDKTGTLTKGVFEVQQVGLAEDSKLTEQALIAMTASLEHHSTHPIAKAIAMYAKKRIGPFPTVSDAIEISGLGMRGILDGKEILTGNTKLLQKYQVPYPLFLDEITETTVITALDGKYLGYFRIADELKPDAIPLVKKLRDFGVKKTVMLSGDNHAVASLVGNQLNIDQTYGDLLPQDKIEKFQSLKTEGKTIAFVGDGINDAPVIALADVGIAMGGLGSDAAIETADVVIQNDQPSKIITAIHIGKKTKQVVWQNIGLAFGVKALILTLAVFGTASLWGAVFADVGVALLAILNAVRIQRMDFS